MVIVLRFQAVGCGCCVEMPGSGSLLCRYSRPWDGVIVRRFQTVGWGAGLLCGESGL